MISEEIYSMSKALAPESQTSHDDSKENPKGIENFEPFEKEQDQHLNTINCFFPELPMVEEEDEPGVIFSVQHPYNTRSKWKIAHQPP